MGQTDGQTELVKQYRDLHASECWFLAAVAFVWPGAAHARSFLALSRPISRLADKFTAGLAQIAA